MAWPDRIAIQSFRDKQNSKQGKYAFVLGNGPSLRILSTPKINSFLASGDFELYCVNHFIRSKFFHSLSEGSAISLVLSDPGSLGHHSNEQLTLVLKSLESKKLTYLYVPSWTTHLQSKRNLASATIFQNIEATKRVFYFNDTQGSSVFSRDTNPLKPRSYINMSVYKALAITRHLGYDKIYVCGVDNTYASLLGNDELNRVYRTDVHFDNTAYPESCSRDYFWAKKSVDMSGALMESATLFLDLKTKFGAFPIVNLDPDSLTDAFPKSTDLDVYLEPYT